jgi:hypothetical protein
MLIETPPPVVPPPPVAPPPVATPLPVVLFGDARAFVPELPHEARRIHEARRVDDKAIRIALLKTGLLVGKLRAPRLERHLLC